MHAVLLTHSQLWGFWAASHLLEAPSSALKGQLCPSRSRCEEPRVPSDCTGTRETFSLYLEGFPKPKTMGTVNTDCRSWNPLPRLGAQQYEERFQDHQVTPIVHRENWGLQRGQSCHPLEASFSESALGFHGASGRPQVKSRSWTSSIPAAHVAHLASSRDRDCPGKLCFSTGSCHPEPSLSWEKNHREEIEASALAEMAADFLLQLDLGKLLPQVPSPHLYLLPSQATPCFWLVGLIPRKSESLLGVFNLDYFLKLLPFCWFTLI